MTIKVPTDLEEEILCRVPAKSLARLRSTCKHWNSLILDERLIRKNLFRIHGEHRFIIKDVDNGISSVGIEEVDPLSFVIEEFTLRRVGPYRPVKVYKIVHCDGLLLCVMDNQLLVWNPLLKETCWIKCGSDFHCFDDAYSIGYLNHCDYRILRFRPPTNSRNTPPRVEVCQLSSKTWKKVLDIINFDWVLPIPFSIVSFRGTPCWIALRQNHTAFLQSFNFSTQRFQPLDDLPFRYDKSNPIALEIIQGDRLSVLEQCHKTRKICIWVKHCLLLPSWTRFMVVTIPHFPLLYPPFSRLSIDYSVDKDGRLVITSIDNNGISIHRIVDESHFQTTVTCFREVSSPFSCIYFPSILRIPGFLKQDTSRIRWRRNRFH